MKIFNLTINDITKINKYAEIDIELAQETLLKKLNINNINKEEKTIKEIEILQKQIEEINRKLKELNEKINNIQTIQVSHVEKKETQLEIPEFIRNNPWVSIIQNKTNQ